MAKRKGQQGLREDRSDRENGQPLQLDEERQQADKHVQDEKEHQAGQDDQQPLRGQHSAGNR